jgi:hypothetical protein
LVPRELPRRLPREVLREKEALRSLGGRLVLRGSSEPSRVVGREAAALLEEKMEVEKIGVPFEFGCLGAIVKKERGDYRHEVWSWVFRRLREGRGRGSGSVWSAVEEVEVGRIAAS